MPKKGNVVKVSAKEFIRDPEKFIKGLGETSGHIVITSRNKPVAYLASAESYEYNRKRLDGYEKLMNELEVPEKARREAHAKVMAELGRRSRRV